jgi:hypothetical protein
MVERAERAVYSEVPQRQLFNPERWINLRDVSKAWETMETKGYPTRVVADAFSELTGPAFPKTLGRAIGKRAPTFEMYQIIDASRSLLDPEISDSVAAKAIWTFTRLQTDMDEIPWELHEDPDFKLLLAETAFVRQAEGRGLEYNLRHPLDVSPWYKDPGNREYGAKVFREFVEFLPNIR